MSLFVLLIVWKDSSPKCVDPLCVLADRTGLLKTKTKKIRPFKKNRISSSSCVVNINYMFMCFSARYFAFMFVANICS